MTLKKKVYLLGFVTLLVFPLPTVIYKLYWEGQSLFEILELSHFSALPIFNGLAFGIAYALLSTYLLKKPLFKDEFAKQQELLDQLNLNAFDAIFLSICAGVGEELLFRAGIQLFLGPIITSVLFIAVHGYYNPKNWRMSIYGVLLTPFILLIAYGYEYFGLWFAIAAHFAYDWVLFNDTSLKKDNFI